MNSVHRALFGMNHRVDGEDPVPRDMVGADGIPSTRLARWLVALREEFGASEIARWGRSRVVRVSAGLALVYANSRVRGAKPGDPARPAFIAARATFCAVRPKGGRFWSLYEAERPRRRCRPRPRPGVFLGVAPDLEEAEVLALFASPKLPPAGSGWTLAEWLACNG